jgi:TusE/DsrC/DsvC family sulfur relay protein
MPDIRKVIANPGSDNPIEADREFDLQGWNETQGKSLARKEDIRLTNEHWEVVHCLREYYRVHGPAENGRELDDMLDREFADRGGRKFLHRLFPKGPVAQGMRIAGLRVPPHTVHSGAGSSR